LAGVLIKQMSNTVTVEASKSIFAQMRANIDSNDAPCTPIYEPPKYSKVEYVPIAEVRKKEPVRPSKQKKQYKPYHEKLKDVRWQRRRLEVLNTTDFHCKSCGKGEDDDVTLHVHHPYYEKGAEPWDNIDLIPVCEHCHKKYEDANRMLGEAMSKIPADAAVNVAGSVLCAILELADVTTPRTADVLTGALIWAVANHTSSVHNETPGFSSGTPDYRANSILRSTLAHQRNAILDKAKKQTPDTDSDKG
jgi:5-methylcytosine-specific restriction endonuclease McrA